MAAITITGGNIADQTLVLSDNGNTVANRGEIVTWNVRPGQGTVVASIHQIKNYSSSRDVFKPDPHSLGSGNSPNWQGTINPDLTPLPATETYYIEWMDTSGGGPWTYDPQITVNR
ncbi:MAG: hypothetical protein OEW87_10445 [Flavobacteriaceae bacterium]|nr:hypothetical protein [Flavobacteriaceae bacterium]